MNQLCLITFNILCIAVESNNKNNHKNRAQRVQVTVWTKEFIFYSNSIFGFGVIDSLSHTASIFIHSRYTIPYTHTHTNRLVRAYASIRMKWIIFTANKFYLDLEICPTKPPLHSHCVLCQWRFEERISLLQHHDEQQQLQQEENTRFHVNLLNGMLYQYITIAVHTPIFI